jgi:hypothetical protein
MLNSEQMILEENRGIKLGKYLELRSVENGVVY